jgi:hypothetical protein
MNPRFPAAEKYLPELWADPRYVNSCGGRLSHFIHTDTAVTALGERLFIRSTGHLYCVGPAVKGTPQDAPAVVAAIRAARKPEAVAKYLDSGSPQYRYEAARRCAELGGAGAAATLKRLATDDPYEGIRAAAIRALGAGPDRPGRELLGKQIAEAVDPKSGRWRDVGGLYLTLHALGADAEGVLAAMLRGDDASARVAAASAIATVGHGDQTVRDALLALLDDRQTTDLAVQALSRWPADPAVRQAFTALLNQASHKQVQSVVNGYLLRHRPADGRAGFLRVVAEKNPDRRVRRDAVTALAALAGADPAALSALQAIDPGDDKQLAEQVKQAIEEIESGEHP